MSLQAVGVLIVPWKRFTVKISKIFRETVYIILGVILAFGVAVALVVGLAK